MTQKAEEGKLWEEIESKKAKERQQLTQFGNSTVMDSVTSPSENGATRDIIASKVGIGSGRTYERAKAKERQAIAGLKNLGLSSSDQMNGTRQGTS